MTKFPNNKRLILRGKAVVYIDWANVYGWRKSLKRKVDVKELFSYLKLYDEIQEARMYFGREIWNIKRGLFKAQLKNLMEI